MTGTMTRTQAERTALAQAGRRRDHAAAALAAAVWMAQRGYCMEEIRRYIEGRYQARGLLRGSAAEAFEIFFASKSYARAVFTAEPCGGAICKAVEQLAGAYYGLPPKTRQKNNQ